MKAVCITEPGSVSVVEIDTPKPGNGEVAIDISHVGFCGSDLTSFRGLNPLVSYPRVPGHEIAGTVVATGAEVPGFKPGDRVATTQRSHVCGHCAHCRDAHEPLCAEKIFLGDMGLNGGYAEYVCAPFQTVLPVPEGLSIVEAAALPETFMTASPHCTLRSVSKRACALTRSPRS